MSAAQGSGSARGQWRAAASPTRIGRWSARRPWRAIGAWLAFVALALGALVLSGGTKSLANGAVGQSARGYSLLDQHQAWPPPHEYAYLHSDSLHADDPAFRAATVDLAARMRAALGARPTVLVSGDRHSVLLSEQITRPPSVEPLALILAAGAAHPAVKIQEASESSAKQARDHAVNRDLHRAELLSVPVTLLVLLFAFGAGVAALVPVLLGLTAVAAAFGLLGPISQAFPLDGSVKTVVLLIGLAVGVDYALFYVIRSREERLRGLDSHEALERTARTSGRTVLISGATVALAMAGMYLVGSDILNGIASGTIAVVACAVAGSVTVLPAVLELLGARIDRGRIPYLSRLRSETGISRFWPVVVERVLRRPLLAAVLSAGLLVALAVPALGLHLAKPSDEAVASQSEPALATLARVRSEFSSTASPAIVVAAAPSSERAALARAMSRLESLALVREIAHPPFSVTEAGDGQAASLELPLIGAGNNAASRNAIALLRDRLVPRTLGRVAGTQTAVTGAAAEDVDFTHQLAHATPYVIGFVLALAFLLLLVTFRSIVVPLKAIVLNLLSLSAAYGVLVLVFQYHWAEGLLGFHANGAVISWLPLFLFVVLFGLSMDYHVFILSRVREAVDSGMGSDDALRYGIIRTAGVVTSAALVMVGVFSLFASLSSLDLKQAGVGLASAILIDATVVRAVLLPASMKLLGDWNWYLPAWLGWLPRVNPERSSLRERPRRVAAPAQTSP